MGLIRQNSAVLFKIRYLVLVVFYNHARLVFICLQRIYVNNVKLLIIVMENNLNHVVQCRIPRRVQMELFLYV